MTHTMTKINEYQGQEEWMCCSCGRHLLICWEPLYRETVIQKGDLFTRHIGIRKNMPMPAKRDVPAALFSDPRLKPWQAWMDESGFEALWDGDIP